MLASLGRFQPAVPLLLRLVLGLVFVAHGLKKLDGGMSAFGQTIARIGLPMPMVLAWTAALVELLGGIFVLIGLFTRWAALLLAIVMYVAITRIHVHEGLVGGYELPLVLFVVAVCLVLSGSGPLSLDRTVLHRDP